MSPPRRVRHLSRGGDAAGNSLMSDLSPPRKSKKDTFSLKEDPRAGLFSAPEIKKELDRKRKEELSRFKEMDPTVSGRGAQPVYRDNEGKRISKEEVLKLQIGEEKPKYRKQLSDFLNTPLGKSLTTIFFLWFALSGWLYRNLIIATWVLPFAAAVLLGTIAKNFVIEGACPACKKKFVGLKNQVVNCQNCGNIV